MGRAKTRLSWNFASIDLIPPFISNIVLYLVTRITFPFRAGVTKLKFLCNNDLYIPGCSDSVMSPNGRQPPLKSPSLWVKCQNNDEFAVQEG
jgi:hypothetical protein